MIEPLILFLVCFNQLFFFFLFVVEEGRSIGIVRCTGTCQLAPIPHDLQYNSLQHNTKIVPITGGIRFHHHYKGTVCCFWVDPMLKGHSKRRWFDNQQENTHRLWQKAF